MCVLSYEYSTTSAGSRQPWSADVFLRRKAAMIGNNHENDLTTLLETLKDTTESQWVINFKIIRWATEIETNVEIRGQNGP